LYPEKHFQRIGRNQLPCVRAGKSGYNVLKFTPEDGHMTIIRKIIRHPAAFPVFLLLTLMAAYGYQVSRMGFYWDDWSLVYLVSLKNLKEFWAFYAFDRPLAAWLYVAITPLLGINPIHWQLFAIVARWAGCMGFWILFKQLWPERKMEAGFAALLLAVYPGFSQQPVSITYSLFWVLYALFIWSLVASISALDKRKGWIWLTVLAVIASLFETLSMEYVIGLEILRPVFFFIVFLRLGYPLKKAVKDALIRWIPYFSVLVFFTWYRFIYFPATNTDPEANAPLLLREILSNPGSGLPHLFQNIAQDLSQALIFAWGKPILPAEIDFTHTTAIFAFVLGLAVAVLAVLLLRKASDESDETTKEAGFALQAILLGFTAVIMGGLPVWSTNRQIIQGMWSDRFSLGLMFGVVILIAGLAGWFAQKQLPRAVFLSIFLALGLAFQVQNTAKYKMNWDSQKDYFTQLLWRAPALKPGTAILGNKVPYGLSAEYSAGFALNTIYRPDDVSGLPFWFFSAISDRGGSIPDFVEGIPLKFELRDMKYESTTTNGLVVYYKYGESCLRVMTPADKNFPNLDDNERELLALSNLNQIIPDSGRTVLPSEIFGSEAPRNWCYYFQKADLARSSGDWQQVVDLNREAGSKGLSPRNGTEYVPVIEAMAHNGAWDEARQLTDKGLELTGSASHYFCDIWAGLRDLDGGKEAFETMEQKLQCGEY